MAPIGRPASTPFSPTNLTMSLKPKVALAQDFLSILGRIPSGIQAKILKWSIRFQADPAAPGINYEKIRQARDPNLRSVRIDQDWRGIVFKPDKGDVYVLMYVDKHDDAYRWAENRRVAVNPVTGALQLYVTETLVEPAMAQARQAQAAETPAPAAPPAQPMFASCSDDDLLALGTPADLLPQVRKIVTEAELDAMQPFLPNEAYEGLFLVAAGDTPAEVLGQRDIRKGVAVDVDDFAKAMETAETQAHFVVVDDEETMAALLNAPLAQWRVFLHPTQRRLSTGARGGPCRILGGAGTGKTVLAMHRAKWLAENALAADQKLLFTTFTKNLAIDIQRNLSSLCPPQAMARIEVANLDSWVHGFLRRHNYEYRIVYGRRDAGAAEAWQKAMALADSSLGLPTDFYEEELEKVVLAQGVATLDDYRVARRQGRGSLLTRAKRDAIWPVFEEYRAGLTARKLKEVDDAFRDAAALLGEKGSGFASVVVDETQDFGPQALRLLRAMVPSGPNDLFLVGDGNQRIYGRHRASMRASGIDIRGRSRKLYLNYRTTEEIRRAGVALLEGIEADDLDEGLDEVRRYKSIAHGPKPATFDVTSNEQAFSKLAELALANAGSGRSLCVIVPTRHSASAVIKHLRGAGLDAQEVTADKADDADARHVRVATMHRAKGLEFDEVILLNLRSDRPYGASQEDLRRLHYVAITRAKRLASIIRG